VNTDFILVTFSIRASAILLWIKAAETRFDDLPRLERGRMSKEL